VTSEFNHSSPDSVLVILKVVFTASCLADNKISVKKLDAISHDTKHRKLPWFSCLLGHLSPVDDSTTQSQHVWSLGFLCCGSDGMELASRLSLGPCSVYRQLQVGSEDSSFRNAIGTSSTLEALRDALYKSTTTTSTITRPGKEEDLRIDRKACHEGAHPL